MQEKSASITGCAVSDSADSAPGATGMAAVCAADSLDASIVAMWLYGRPATTLKAYSTDCDAFRTFVGKSLAAVGLADLQAFAESLIGSPAYRARRLSAVKSLLSFAAKIGAIPFNVGAALRLPQVPTGLAGRIISEEEVFRLLAAAERRPRDHALLRLLYSSGLRIAELCGVRWRDVAIVAESGVVSVVGKGGKERSVRISQGTLDEIVSIRANARDDEYVFRGRDGRPLVPSTAWRILRRCARHAGIKKALSPHWLRHANASHALSRGADIAVVRDSLGHASLAVTSRYVHARPNLGTSDYLAL